MGVDVANSYYRVPWALAVVGGRDEATVILFWAEREAASTGSQGAAATWAHDSKMAAGSHHCERHQAGRHRSAKEDSRARPSHHDHVDRACRIPVAHERIMTGGSWSRVVGFRSQLGPRATAKGS